MHVDLLLALMSIFLSYLPSCVFLLVFDAVCNTAEEAQEKSSPNKEQKGEKERGVSFSSNRFDMSQIPMLDPDMSGRPLLERSSQGQEEDMLNSPITLQKVDTDFVDKWSHEISTKLLCGWKLLDEVCVRSAGGCFGDLPLVKDLNGEVSECEYQLYA